MPTYRLPDPAHPLLDCFVQSFFIFIIIFSVRTDGAPTSDRQDLSFLIVS